LINRGESIELDIIDLAFGGKGIAKISTENGDYVLFVENTFPGQRVLARVTKKRKRHAECSLLKVIQRSPDEVVSDFQEISGAPYIYVPIELQQKLKEKNTLEVYKRLGDITDVETLFDEFIPSPDIFFYRNKMEYSFSSIEHDLETDDDVDDAFALGFKHRGTWWKVENLNKPSGLFDEQWERELIHVRNYLFDTGLKAWHPPGKHGFFRHIVVRKSFDQDRLLLNLVTSSEGAEKFDAEASGR
jgi:tRNA/tmRNA/rRNA uracil-C5-methylase (TrmA/RlmC/RlmD family)